MRVKKIISVLLAAVLGLVGTVGCAAQSDEKVSNEQFVLTMQIGSPMMTVNGESKAIDENGSAPLLKDDRTLLPVRAVVEEMGGTVLWNGEAKEVTLNYGENEIKLVINSKTAFLNGEEREIDVAPVIIESRTYLPIRFIAESFNFEVGWEQATQTITIANKAEKPTEEAKAEETKPSGKDTLVVYFSATGTTKTAAELIAKAENADLFEIEPSQPYESADLDWTNSESRVSKEHSNPEERKVELKTQEVSGWADYKTVFIGYPIWWGIAAWPVSSFVSANDFEGKTVIPFCTSASSGLGNSGELLKEEAKSGNWLDGKRFSSGVDQQEVDEWIKGLNTDAK